MEKKLLLIQKRFCISRPKADGPGKKSNNRLRLLPAVFPTVFRVSLFCYRFQLLKYEAIKTRKIIAAAFVHQEPSKKKKNKNGSKAFKALSLRSSITKLLCGVIFIFGHFVQYWRDESESSKPDRLLIAVSAQIALSNKLLSFQQVFQLL